MLAPVRCGVVDLGGVIVNRRVPDGSSPGCGRECRGRERTKVEFTRGSNVGFLISGIRLFTGDRQVKFVTLIFAFIVNYLNVGILGVMESCGRRTDEQAATIRGISSTLLGHRRAG